MNIFTRHKKTPLIPSVLPTPCMDGCNARIALLFFVLFFNTISAFAWHVEGYVKCGGVPVANEQVKVYSQLGQYDENIYTDANGYYKKILDGEPAWVNVQVRNINKEMNPLLQQNNYVAVVDFINEIFCNNPPTCINSSETTCLGEAITKPVGSFDLDGDNLTFSLVNQPSSGSVNLYNRDATNGEYVYTPGTATGNITFTYKVTDSKGASSGNCTVTITVNKCNSPPTCNNSSETTCLGQAITKPVGSFDPDGDNLTFSLVNQPSSGSVNLYNRDATNGEYVYTPGTATGNITFTYKVTDSKGASSGNCTVTINVKPLPVITVNSASICVNAQATLTASGCSGGTVTWSNGSSGSSITVSPNATTNYTATCNLNGCTGSGTGTVFVNYPANISVDSKAICPGGTATLTASSNCSGIISWNTGATGSTITISPAATTTYYATCTSNGCTSTANGTVTVSPTPIISVNTQTICAGSPATLTASGCGGTVTWNTGATGATLTVTPATTTNYVATCTQNGCTASATGTVTVNPKPTITVNTQTICAGTNATLTASGCGGTVTWNTGATGATLTVAPTATTSYVATCTQNGCTASATGTVTVNPKPTITVNTQTICAGANATLTASGCTGTVAWNTGATGATLTVAPTATTSYVATCMEISGPLTSRFRSKLTTHPVSA